MSSKNSNKINVPEARAAMDKFKMESKLNKKYIDLYAKQSKHSLIVVYQNKLLNFFRRIANWIGNRA